MTQFFGKMLSKVKGAKTFKSVPDEYKCQCCGEIKPLNTDHFQIVNKFKHGYSTYCNVCHVVCNRPKEKTKL